MSNAQQAAVLDHALVAVGGAWDVLRIPDARGLPLFAWLSADPEDRQRLGPVVHSRRSAVTYWLIPTGTVPEAWPADCRLLSRGSWVSLPSYGLDDRSARWLHLPDDDTQLTGATWLAAALDTTRSTP